MSHGIEHILKVKDLGMSSPCKIGDRIHMNMVVLWFGER
jgi:hypothetical protein